MKKLFLVGGMGALLMAGASMLMAQDDHRNDRQENAQPQNRQEQARPEDRGNQQPESGNRQETTPQNEGRPEKQPQSGDRHPQNQENNRQVQQQQEKQQQRMDKEQEQMNRQQGREQNRREHAQPQQPMQNGQQARAPRRENQRRISDNDFHAHFGREHRFAPGRMQVYEGRPQFTYTGYVFELVEPWPSEWAYDADDYYIDYFDGEYWLCSFSHPEMRLELIIIG